MAINATVTCTEPELLDIAIGAAIRLRRQQIGFSLQALAERCGITFQQLQKYENGANRVSFSRLVLIAHARGLRLCDLVGDIDQAPDLSSADTTALTHLALPGAVELLADFARLKGPARQLVRYLMRDMVDPRH